MRPVTLSHKGFFDAKIVSTAFLIDARSLSKQNFDLKNYFTLFKRDIGP